MLRITLVTTSARVAPGVLTAPAWDLLRSVPVFCGSPDHPQRAALAEAGVPVEVVDIDSDVDPGAARTTDAPGHLAGSRVPVVSEAFVAALRERAAAAGVTEVAWLTEPAHALPGKADTGVGRPEPVAGQRSQAGKLPGQIGHVSQSGEPVVSTVSADVGVRVMGGVPDVPGQIGHVGQLGVGLTGEPGVSTAPADVEIRVLAGTRELPGSALLDAVAVMDRLRSPGGCPWDAEQTHASLAPYLLEEAYEAYQAIEDGDLAELREELGDVLLQVLFHARVAAEGAGDGAEGAEGGELASGGSPSSGPGGDRSPWDVDAVAVGLVAKLVRRHPHVFGDVTVDGAGAVARNWEVIKDAEKGRVSVTDGIPLSLPALSLASKLLSRSARIGIPSNMAFDRVAGDAGSEATARPRGNDLPATVAALAHRIAQIAQGAGVDGDQPEPDIASLDTEVGLLIFAAVALASVARVDPEAALRRVSRTFRDRVIEFEQRAAESASGS